MAKDGRDGRHIPPAPYFKSLGEVYYLYYNGGTAFRKLGIKPDGKKKIVHTFLVEFSV